MALVLAALVFPAPILTGRIVEFLMDATNPAGLTDLSVGLAYLTEILVWSFTVLILVLVWFVVVAVIIARRSRSMRLLRAPLIVLGVQVLCGVAILALSARIDGIGG